MRMRRVGSAMLLLCLVLALCSCERRVYEFEGEGGSLGDATLVVGEDRYVFSMDGWHAKKKGPEFGRATLCIKENQVYKMSLSSVKGDDNRNFIFVGSQGWSLVWPIMVKSDVQLPTVGKDVPDYVTYSRGRKILVSDLISTASGEEGAKKLVVDANSFGEVYLDCYYDDFPGVYHPLRVECDSIKEMDFEGEEYMLVEISAELAKEILKRLGHR